MIPAKGASIYNCPQGIVGVSIPLFEAGLRLPTSNFFDMIVHHYGFSVDELTPNAVNKIVCFELIFRKSLNVVPSSDEETESDDAGLLPRRARRTVSLTRLVGGIRGVLSDRFSVPEQKEIVVVPGSTEASPFPFACSPLVNLDTDSMFGRVSSSPGGSFQREKPSLVDEVGTPYHSLSFGSYALGWAITRDSLLSEDIAAQEWSRCAHLPKTMSSLAGQSSARMVGNLCRSQIRLLPLWLLLLTGFAASNCIVACEKPSLEDHVATLEDQLERNRKLGRFGGSCVHFRGLVREDLQARCQHQLARARVYGAIDRGGLQWILEKGVVHVIDKVIKSVEFPSRIQGIREACEALGLEKGKQLGGCSTSVGEPEVLYPGLVVRRAEEVDTAISSLLRRISQPSFIWGKLYYDDFCQFFRRLNPRCSSSDSEG
ncbi:unnamed protein product [Lactuca saligna]|uniref:Transposase (putative) gypsy type domain-containing protein n=1 Tax=Lactuca saligna TaxID=75948 RepID=A0AA35VN96_LACSI|nr:unnamed protein product [Lactuca saligna]